MTLRLQRCPPCAAALFPIKHLLSRTRVLAFAKAHLFRYLSSTLQPCSAASHTRAPSSPGPQLLTPEPRLSIRIYRQRLGPLISHTSQPRFVAAGLPMCAWARFRAAQSFLPHDQVRCQACAPGGAACWVGPCCHQSDVDTGVADELCVSGTTCALSLLPACPRCDIYQFMCYCIQYGLSVGCSPAWDWNPVCACRALACGCV